LIPETTQENLATAPDSANIDRFQARHRQQLCLGRQPAAATHIIRCFPKSLIASENLDDPEYIISATLKQYARCDPELLTREILEQLWEAGYDVRPNRL